jgi:hypothetical protein
MKAVWKTLDELLPLLAFLVYVAVEAVVICGMLRWAGAI